MILYCEFVTGIFEYFLGILSLDNYVYFRFREMENRCPIGVQ